MPKPIILDLENDYERQSQRLGSNQGGFFKRKDDGKAFYIKWLSAEKSGTGERYQNRAVNRMHNEYLASKLYELFGVSVPKSELFTFVDKKGKQQIGIVSEKQEGIELLSRAFEESERNEKSKTFENVCLKAQNDFLIDVLLSNYDVVGLEMDNLHYNTVTNEPMRIDPGGALKYRAQGGPKKEKKGQFNDDVFEFEEMESGKSTKTDFNEEVLQQANRVFKGVHQSSVALIAGLEKLKAVSDQQIRDCVNQNGFATIPKGNKKNEALIDLLLVRKERLIQKVEEKLKVLNVPAPAQQVSSGADSKKRTELKDIFTTFKALLRSINPASKDDEVNKVNDIKHTSFHNKQ